MDPYIKFVCTKCGVRNEPCEHYTEHQQMRLLREIVSILWDLRATLIYPHGGKIVQKWQENPMTPAGGTSQFAFQPTPTGAQFPAGTTFTWSVDDTADITLTPNGLDCQAVCVAAPTGTSYNLTFASNYTPPGASAPTGGTLNVVIGILPTGGTIVQTS